jgi:UDP-N-acetylmuramoyl-tripeptide--D-alanyl-D-alanine ligase
VGWNYSISELAKVLGAVAPASDATFSAVSTDSRTVRPGNCFFALSGPNFKGSDFVQEAFAKGAVAAVTDAPCPSGACITVKDPLEALQGFARHHRDRYTLPLIAVTGSCGKTSTKDMIAEVLATRYNVVKTQGNLNNEIGCPLSLLHIDESTQAAIIEMGANHLGEIRHLCSIARPTESAITMIGSAHLEGFGTLENVVRAKGEIVECLDPAGTFYVNADDANCRHVAQRFDGRTIYFGSTGDVVLRSCTYSEKGELELQIDPVGTLHLPLACRAHVTNVLLAVAVGVEHGVTEFEAPLRQAIASGVRFRVLRIGPIEVIDDTYNANPSSVRASLEAAAERPSKGARFAALGEMLELGASAAELHRDIGRYAGEVGISCLYARGPNASATVAGALEAGVTHAEVLEDHHAIANAIFERAQSGDVVLVKGSRGMKMERVVEALDRLYR